jgi:hypothetical protein
MGRAQVSLASAGEREDYFATLPFAERQAAEEKHRQTRKGGVRLL